MAWDFIYFKPAEFACRCGCGLQQIDPELVKKLEAARALINRPIIITSGTRCPEHNARIGGAIRSAHLVGPDGFSHAADIKILSDQTRYELKEIFRELGIRRFEVSNKHLHIDNAKDKPAPILAATFFKE